MEDILAEIDANCRDDIVDCHRGHGPCSFAPKMLTSREMLGFRSAADPFHYSKPTGGIITIMHARLIAWARKAWSKGKCSCTRAKVGM
jgi:hypothetical protein